MIQKFTGMGWQHDRCMLPLYASADSFGKNNLGFEIDWSSRSLADFGDGHLEKLISEFDFIVFDHPFVGQASEEGLLINLKDHLNEDELKGYKSDSLGPCWDSYHANDGVWALPIDAAAQVASYTPSLLEKHDIQPPKNIDQVFGLAELLKKDDCFIALPCVPIDAICLFLSFTAALGDPVIGSQDGFPKKSTSLQALESIRQLIDIAHPLSLNWNPIQCFDYMTENDDVLYQPFAFGYSNYSRQENKGNHVKFTNIPAIDKLGCQGSILGGAGIGITRSCQNIPLALEYIKFVCSAEYQSNEYTQSGGQPASLTAWLSKESNQITDNFFLDTLNTLQKSYLRPTHNGIIPWFRNAGVTIHQCLSTRSSLEQCENKLRESYHKSFD